MHGCIVQPIKPYRNPLFPFLVTCLAIHNMVGFGVCQFQSVDRPINKQECDAYIN